MHRPRLAQRILTLLCRLLTVALVVGCGKASEKKPEQTSVSPGTPKAAVPAARGRLVMLGFDGVDPRWLERWVKQGKLPTLAKLMAAHGGRAYRPLGSTNPPQSPVAWTSFATGTLPGDHGIYDFIGRTMNPGSALPVMPKIATTSFEVQPAGPPVARNLREGQAFWQLLGNADVRVVALHVPYSFPPDPMRSGRMLSGLGVPDLRETNSTFTYAASDLSAEQVRKPPGGGVLARIERDGKRGRFELEGPSVPGSTGERMRLPVVLERAGEGLRATVAGQSVSLTPGNFSDWVELEFAHRETRVKGICKLLTLSTPAELRVFVTPISIHPRQPYSPFSYPKAFAAQIADELASFYKTVGWDHDTSSLNAEVVDESVFLDDMNSIESQSRTMLLARLDQPDWDLLIWVSTGTDRVAHMFYRLTDPEHPRYDAALAARYGDAIEKEYARMDATVAVVLERLRPDDTLLILSDHGFHGYRRGLHVNQWLREQGWLVLKGGATVSDREFFLDVDWSKTRAYSLGTGQIYINRRGREPSGIVDDASASALARTIRETLIALRDAERAGAKVIDDVYLGSEVFQGARSAERPDLQIAFADPYRASWETALGAVPRSLFADNTKKWSGDHAASDVKNTPGILISSRPLAEGPSIIDLAPTAVAFFGQQPPKHYAGKSVFTEPK
jgi:predicted AlkP superfamily phosphohydrolase/phosphomutase